MVVPAALPPLAVPHAGPHAGPRYRALAAVALGVLLAHAWLLDEVAGLGGGRDGPRERPPALNVRQVVLPPPASPAPPPAVAEPAPAPPRPAPAPSEASPAPGPALAPVAEEEHMLDERAPQEGLGDTPQPEVAPIVDAAASGPPPGVAVVSSVQPASSPAPGSVPTYPTQAPPSAEIAYTVKRGNISASGTLRWRAEGGRYEMSLVGSLLGVTVLEQTSQGAFDAAGLAPERFTDRRSGRDLRAANFRRDSGQVSFSAATHQLPLLPGAQDRLSWMAQLAAIALADPGRLLPGAQVSMFVVGARGDGDLWTFTVRNAQADGLIELVREPRKEFDNRIEVWVHARRGFWPVRALQTQKGGDGSFELVLEDGPNPLVAR